LGSGIVGQYEGGLPDGGEQRNLRTGGGVVVGSAFGYWVWKGEEGETFSDKVLEACDDKNR